MSNKATIFYCEKPIDLHLYDCTLTNTVKVEIEGIEIFDDDEIPTDRQIDKMIEITKKLKSIFEEKFPEYKEI